MNKYILRYIVEHIRESKYLPCTLSDLAETEEPLRILGFDELLTIREKSIVIQELIELAELEQFKDRHSSNSEL